MDILEILALAKARKASDLHLSVGSPPLVRVNGELMQVLEFASSTQEEVKSMFMQITMLEGIEKFQKDHELDFKYIHRTAPDCAAVRHRSEAS